VTITLLEPTASRAIALLDGREPDLRGFHDEGAREHYTLTSGERASLAQRIHPLFSYGVRLRTETRGPSRTTYLELSQRNIP